VWPVGVVLVPERVDRRLRGLDAGPDLDLVEEFALQGLVEPLDLPGCGRGAGFGVAGDDAVLPADPFEHHLGRAGLGEPSGELFAVVGQHFVGDPEPLQRLTKRPADGAAGGLTHHSGDDAVPGMVIHPRHDLGFGAVGQSDAADDVKLPQLHRHFPLPPAVVLTATTARDGVDQAMPYQHPVDRGHRRNRPGTTVTPKLELDPPLPPAGM
jgi:hypothetical protein